MVKVNYFEYVGTDSKGDEVKAIGYGRSKREVKEIAESIHGVEIPSLDNVRMLNLKTEVVNTLDMHQMFDLREEWRKNKKEVNKRKD